MGFANLQALENRLSSLKSNLSSYNTQLDKQKKRKANIESIIKDMKSVCNNRTDDVNTHLNKMINNYEDATKGVSSASTLVSTTTADKEKDVRGRIVRGIAKIDRGVQNAEADEGLGEGVFVVAEGVDEGQAAFHGS